MNAESTDQATPPEELGGVLAGERGGEAQASALLGWGMQYIDLTLGRIRFVGAASVVSEQSTGGPAISQPL